MTQNTTPTGEPAAERADGNSGATVASGANPVATDASRESPDAKAGGSSSKDRLRIGLIGPGSVANGYLIPALLQIENASFWSVCGRDEGRTREFATRHKAAAKHPVFTDLNAFLADPQLDAVIIASPDKLHAAQAIAAAKAGKHVFVEKPMATTHEDAVAIVAACAEAKVQLAVGYHLRFHSGHKLVAELIAAGRIGKILHANVSWTLIAKEPDWRASAEMGRWWSLAALGTHALDLVRWLVMPSCGTVKQSTTVCSSPVFGSAHDETALVSMLFDSGATAQIMTSVVMRAPRMVEIFGSGGFIRCTETLGPRGTGKIVVNDEELEFVSVNPYKAELEDFIAAIKTGAIPFVNGDEGLANVALLEHIWSNAVKQPARVADEQPATDAVGGHASGNAQVSASTSAQPVSGTKDNR